MVGQTMTFPWKTVRDIPLDNQVVLVRADYNVPLAADGTIGDEYRLRQSLPTLRYLIKRGCRVVICSHLGRPEGAIDPRYSLEPVAHRLSELLNQSVQFVSDSVGDSVHQAVKQLQSGQVVLLENLRFHPEEEANDISFAHDVAVSSGARYFVQDGFGVVHRAHASTDAITQFLPSVAGLLLEKEYVTIMDAVQHPKRPLVAVLGGAKVSDKISVIERFVEMADRIIIGGAMANTFLQVQGLPVGKSKYEEGMRDTIDRIDAAIRQKADSTTQLLLLPSDVAVARQIDQSEPRTVIPVSEVADDQYILDIGDNSIDTAVAAIDTAQTVVWSGTLGMAELPEFAHGSARVALALAQREDITSIIGGGDTVDFALKWDARGGDSFTNVSTGGSASLELIAGKTLPGIAALLKR